MKEENSIKSCKQEHKYSGLTLITPNQPEATSGGFGLIWVVKFYIKYPAISPWAYTHRYR